MKKLTLYSTVLYSTLWAQNISWVLGRVLLYSCLKIHLWIYFCTCFLLSSYLGMKSPIGMQSWIVTLIRASATMIVICKELCRVNKISEPRKILLRATGSLRLMVWWSLSETTYNLYLLQLQFLMSATLHASASYEIWDSNFPYYKVLMLLTYINICLSFRS